MVKGNGYGSIARK